MLKGNGLSYHHIVIITRSCAKGMSTNGPSSIKENTYEIALLKEQIAKMMRMMQNLVIKGSQDSSGLALEGFVPQSKSEAWSPPNSNQRQATWPFVPQRGD